MFGEKGKQRHSRRRTFYVVSHYCNTRTLKKGFIVTCDSSSTGIGSIFSQVTLGHDLPVAYANRVLAKAERNYSSIERELTAIVWGCKQFRQYIWGRKFTIVTDH